jgi:shikimate kinase
MSRERSAPERGRGVVLVGYRATGKSTVGRLLAGRLGLPFHDADPVLEARHGRPIRTIFTELGEPVFRDWEHQVLADLTAGPPCVLATGGGAVLRPENRALLRGHGFVVWLSAPPDVLAARLAASPGGLADRPALTPAGTRAEIAEVLTARMPLYREVADAEVATDGRTVDDVVAAVLRVLSGVGT